MKKLISFLIKRTILKNFDKWKGFIKEQYIKLTREDFEIKSEIVKVKKGKKRYNLLFIETKEGRLRVNLGRHINNKLITSEITQ